MRLVQHVAEHILCVLSILDRPDTSCIHGNRRQVSKTPRDGPDPTTHDLGLTTDHNVHVFVHDAEASQVRPGAADDLAHGPSTPRLIGKERQPPFGGPGDVEEVHGDSIRGTPGPSQRSCQPKTDFHPSPSVEVSKPDRQDRRTFDDPDGRGTGAPPPQRRALAPGAPTVGPPPAERRALAPGTPRQAPPPPQRRALAPEAPRVGPPQAQRRALAPGAPRQAPPRAERRALASGAPRQGPPRAERRGLAPGAPR
jgi:hypothetical protein